MSENEKNESGPVADGVALGDAVKVELHRGRFEPGDKVQHVDDPATGGRVLRVSEDGARVQVAGIANWIPAGKLRKA